jgi:dethiobiotin synthetase
LLLPLLSIALTFFLLQTLNIDIFGWIRNGIEERTDAKRIDGSTSLAILFK